MNTNQKIAALREAMQSHQLDAYLVPSGDPHQSEYLASHWQSRQWISGFTGSAGMLVVTPQHAGLWTDSRYFIQAEEELADSDIVLQKQVIPHAPEHIMWLVQHLDPGSTVGCDGKVFSVAQMNALEKAFNEKNIKINYTLDLISEIWTDRPDLPKAPVYEHAIQFTGLGRTDKIEQVRSKMKADYHLISTLDDIAWLTNLRSSDVTCNPVAISYVMVAPDTTHLFIDLSKLDEDLKARLSADNISLHSYDDILPFLSNLPSGKNIHIHKGSTNISMYNAVASEQVVHGLNICMGLKAIKNATERNHIEHAMIKDGVALTRLYRWLDSTLDERSVSEVEVAEKLASFRSEQDGYKGESFGAIVGYKGNGAIVHYSAAPETCAMIEKTGILLLDSGGQYLDGTTDITRTTALGTPTAEQKRNFTLVLKGHIALAKAKFPYGTKGIQLDAFARQHLWQHGLNYGHGTGHGVGFFLNVHEGPQGFATSITTQRGSSVLEPGMFTSNEPGFYKNGEYGIRIENLIFTEEAEETDFGRFLQFKTVTLFPIDLNLVEASLLNESEKQWLNDYHQLVFEKLVPHLNEEEVEWMKVQCGKV